MEINDNIIRYHDVGDVGHVPTARPGVNLRRMQLR